MGRLRNVKAPTVTLLIVGCFGLLLLVVLNLVFGQRAFEAFEKVNASREVRTVAVNLRSALQTAESSQRGFLVSGNEVYLAPFATAKDDAERSMLVLQDKAGKSAASGPALLRLTDVVTDKLAELTESIDLYRNGNTEESVALLSALSGKALMDETNVFISAIVRTAERDLSASVTDQQESLRILRVGTYLAVLLVFLVTAGVFLIQRSFVRDLRKANDEVQSMNQHLESRVEERTKDLALARDRAEILLAEVNHRVANSLTMVASMVGMQARATGNEDTKRILADTQARINAVAVVHKQLYATTNVQSVDLQDFLPNLLDQIAGSLRSEGLSANLSNDVQAIDLPTDQTISLGIIVTEWVTNAFKYAYPGHNGEIRVRLRKLEEGYAQMSVEDDGVGRGHDALPKGTGLGSKLVSAMAVSLGAKIEYLDRKPGTEARLVMPL